MTDFIPGNFSDYGRLSTISSPYTVKEREDLFELLPKNIKIKSMIELGCADGNNLIYFKDKLKLKKYFSLLIFPILVKIYITAYLRCKLHLRIILCDINF